MGHWVSYGRYQWVIESVIVCGSWTACGSTKFGLCAEIQSPTGLFSLFARSLSCPRRWFLAMYKSDFHEICHGCSASTLNVTVNFWELKVKVQGQNHRSENLSLVLARQWFKICSSKLAIRVNFGTKYDFLQNTRWRPGGSLHYGSAFLGITINNAP